METHFTESEVVFQMREADDQGDIIASGYGRAVPYDTPTKLGAVSEQFARDAFDPDEVLGKPLAYRHGEPIGRITGAENREDGLYIDFEIVNTAAGRDAAVLARTGSSKGLSVGFEPITST